MKTKTDWKKEEEERKRRTRGQIAKVGWIHITGSVEELETLTRLGMKGLIDSLIVLTVQRILYTIARYKYGDNYQY